MSNSKQNKATFFVKISAPAQRALQNKGISNVQELARYSKAEILGLHGMGPGSIPSLESALAAAGLSFKTD